MGSTHKFTVFVDLPKELRDKIVEMAICKPGIHFFTLDEVVDPAVFPRSQTNNGNTLARRVLKEPYPRGNHDLVRVEDDRYSNARNSWVNFLGDANRPLTPPTTPRLPPSAPSQGVGWFDLTNPSAYASNGRLQTVSKSFKADINRLCSGRESWANIGPTGRIKINANNDIICLQLPHRLSRWFITPLDLGPLGFICDTLPELAPVKKLAIEFEPIRWKSENKFDAHRLHPDKKGYLWICFLPLHFPSLETVYLLDYTIKLKGGRLPSPSAEIFHGSTHDYVEVLDEDPAWGRQIDPLFDGLISYHQRGWTEFFRNHQVNYTEIGRWMASYEIEDNPESNYRGFCPLLRDYFRRAWDTLSSLQGVDIVSKTFVRRAMVMKDVPLDRIKPVEFKLLARIDKAE